MKRTLAGLTALGLLSGLGSATAAPAASAALAPSAAPAASDPIVIARTARLTHRPTGLPSTDVPARRLMEATVRQDLDRGRVSGRFVLQGTPTTDTTADLTVAFGYLEGDDCQADAEFTTPTLAPAGGFSRSGDVITLDKSFPDAELEPWDCAFAATTGPGRTPTYDALINELTDVHLKPDLRITRVRLLGSKRIRLVPGVWTTLEVRIRNASRADAPGTVLRGSGRRIRIRDRRVGSIRGESAVTERIKVKLTRKRRTRIKLLARTSGSRAVERIQVRPRSAPPRPRSGKYRGADGNVVFRIRDRKVRGFRARVYTRCGTFPDYSTYYWHYYGFPKTRIPRNGIVDRIDRHDLFSVGLRMYVQGGRVTKGRFWYSGPNSCYGSVRFKARRR